MLSRIRRRAKAKGVPFNLTLEDIKLPVLCPVLGIPLDYEYKNGRLNSNSPSLDRRIPELGYVKGNVEVISMKANTIKAYATPEEILYDNWAWALRRKRSNAFCVDANNWL